MALTVADVLARTDALLFDPGRVRWSLAEMLGYINDAERDIASLKPDATAQPQTLLLVPGILQSLPSNTLRLLTVHRNMGADGLTPGRQIGITEEEVIQAYAPDWGKAYAATAVENYTYDERDVLHFRVYPPVHPTIPVYVEVTRMALPGELSATTDALAVGDWYFNAVVQFVMAMALAKDAEVGALSQQSQAWKALYDSSMSQMTQTQVLSSPNTAVEGGQAPKMARGG